MPTALHTPVLPQEVLTALHVQPGKWYLDGTFGRGGHTQSILTSGGKVIAFDWDSEAIAYGKTQFAAEIDKDRLILIHESFDRMQPEIAQLQKRHSQLAIAGILFDFGTSTDQLKDPNRGFSFEGKAELDMRMDTRQGVTAKDLLAVLGHNELREMFVKYGGEPRANAIAKGIVKFRERNQHGPTTSQELVDIIMSVYQRRTSHLHPATKVFQALRIVVNSELEAIASALPQALEVLEENGHIVAIAFHEGEDRIVKHLFKNWQRQGKGVPETKRPLMAGETELTHNPNARSAKLRIFRKEERHA